MRAILVSVDYADLLAITLPYNRHHFESVMVVTSRRDGASYRTARDHDCLVHVTDSFYADGAVFNKWRALEEGLDMYGREGWLVVMDADVLWPCALPQMDLQVGTLYSPYRRMFPDLRQSIPPEQQWQHYPRHRQTREWAGFSQIFHAADPHLPRRPPWHQTDWRHAGGADSFFQQLWPPQRKERLPWDVLHLGPAGANWCGRTTPYTDGTVPALAQRRRAWLKRFLSARKGKAGPEKFRQERISLDE